jgi:hypothetical protein
MEFIQLMSGTFFKCNKTAAFSIHNIFLLTYTTDKRYFAQQIIPVTTIHLTHRIYDSLCNTVCAMTDITQEMM